jgi:hypothetical protein
MHALKLSVLFMLAAVPVVAGCGAPLDGEDATETDVAEAELTRVEEMCAAVQPTDVIIADLVKTSWDVKYPLTRLRVAANGQITGPSLPPALVGQLEVLNTIPEARDAVATALVKVSGLPDYGMVRTASEVPFCASVPAWSPNGTIAISTTAIRVFPSTTNRSSWETTSAEFGKVSRLVRPFSMRDIVDPPSDGSTSAPPSATVSATGYVANSFGVCPSTAPVGAYCKLSTATGSNFSGRKCVLYYGQKRCLLAP